MLSFSNLFHQIQMIWILNQFIHIWYIMPKPLGIGMLSHAPAQAGLSQIYSHLIQPSPLTPLLTHQESYFQLQLT